MPTTLADVIAVLEQHYPARLAEPWDGGIGLTCGDPAQPVRTVLLAVDVDPRTVGQAVDLGADLLLTHHPLLFRPVQSVAADTPKGALIHRLGRAGVAHFAAHTNADRAVGGVNDALAAALGLQGARPVAPVDGDPAAGLGRIGDLPAPMTAREFAAMVSTSLPATVTGARLAGDPDRLISRVAVCGGSGGGLLDAVAATGADAFVTADLSHHTAAEYTDDPAHPVLVDVAHWASEWPWLSRAAGVLNAGMSLVTVVSEIRTDPWTARVDRAG